MQQIFKFLWQAYFVLGFGGYCNTVIVDTVCGNFVQFYVNICMIFS